MYQLLQEKHERCHFQSGMIFIEDGDDTLLYRRFHGERMAPEPWKDKAREDDVMRLLLPVGDRTTNGDRCNCLYFIFLLVII